MGPLGTLLDRVGHHFSPLLANVKQKVDNYIVKCTYLVIFKVNAWGAVCFCFVHTAELVFRSMLTLRLHN